MEINPNIEEASTIPASFYTSPKWFEQSKEMIFARTWQFCLGTDELTLPGQMVPITLLPTVLDEPILFIRDTEDKMHCLSNVCTHRGNMLVTNSCIGQQLKCRYHGRRFKLNGEFLHMPAFEKVKDFPSSKDNLSKIPFAKLGTFYFAALNPRIPFDTVFQDIMMRLAWFPFQNLRLDQKRSREYLVKTHWALYCENYLDSLHIPFIHQSLRKVLDFENYTTELFRYSNLQLALAGDGCDYFELPEDSIDYGKRIAAYYFWIFPNTMLNFYPWGCSINIVKPLGIATTKVTFLTYVFDESKLNQSAGVDLDRVEREDESVVETVQLGMRSRFYNTGRYSPTMERGTHHFHQLICEFLTAGLT